MFYATSKISPFHQNLMFRPQKPDCCHLHCHLVPRLHRHYFCWKMKQLGFSYTEFTYSKRFQVSNKQTRRVEFLKFANKLSHEIWFKEYKIINHALLNQNTYISISCAWASTSSRLRSSSFHSSESAHFGVLLGGSLSTGCPVLVDVLFHLIFVVSILSLRLSSLGEKDRHCQFNL